MSKKHSKAKAKPAPTSNSKAAMNLRKLVGLMAVRNLVARYDSLKRNDPTRRMPEIRTDLTETEQWYSVDRRIIAIAQCDELADNTSVGSSVETACRLTIGDKLEPVFTGDDGEFWQSVWDEWAKSCGHAEDETWHEMLSIVLRTVLIHGDVFCLLDETLSRGKLRLWDSDQCTDIQNFDSWKAERNAPEDWRQCNGVVLDGSGRVQGYFLTALRNRYAVSNDDAIFLPRNLALRLSLKRKITEYRGEPTAILRQEQVSQDSKDLLRAEIASGKLASEMSLVVEQPDQLDSSGLGGILNAFEDKGELLEETEITEKDLATLTEVANDSKTFEAFGDKAAIATVPAGTKVTNVAPQRPSQQMMTWQGMLDTSVGKSLGMMSCLSNGKADKSFSAGEIELEISWAAFKQYAKMLSKLVTYCAERICPHQKFEITYTEPISIDAEKEEKVSTMRIQSGRSTLREQLGPRYKEKLQQLAYEKKLLEELDLTTLAPFWQTQSGQVIQEQTPEPIDPPDEEQDEI